MKTETIHFDHGHSFDRAIRIISGIFGITGIVSIFSGGILAILVGVIILTCALYAVTVKSGAIINREKKQIWEYISYYGIKTGKWISLQKFPHLVILRLRAPSPLFRKDDAPKEIYKLYLMTKSHHNRILLQTFEDHDEARARAAQFSKELGLEVKNYSPRKITRRRG